MSEPLAPSHRDPRSRPAGWTAPPWGEPPVVIMIMMILRRRRGKKTMIVIGDGDGGKILKIHIEPTWKSSSWHFWAQISSPGGVAIFNSEFKLCAEIRPVHSCRRREIEIYHNFVWSCLQVHSCKIDFDLDLIWTGRPPLCRWKRQRKQWERVELSRPGTEMLYFTFWRQDDNF